MIRNTQLTASFKTFVPFVAIPSGYLRKIHNRFHIDGVINIFITYLVTLTNSNLADRYTKHFGKPMWRSRSKTKYQFTVGQY